MKRAHLFHVLLRIALGGIFLYAGAMKIVNPTAFAGSIAAYQILPYFINYLIAATLPWLECICGLLLILGYRTKAAATILLLLNLIFILALTSTIIRGLDIDCGCFGQGGKTSAWMAILRDIVLVTMAVVALRGARQPTVRSK